MKPGTILQCLFFVLWIVLPSAAAAQDTKRPEIVGVRVGIADRYKAGLWTQVDVTLRGGSEALVGEVSVVVPDGDGVPGRTATPAARPCQLLPGREATVRLITRFGQVEGELAAQFRAEGRLLASRTFAAALQADGEHFLPAVENRKLVVVVGDSTLGVEDAGKLAGWEAERRPVAARIADVEQLPTHVCAYEGVDAVVFSTSRPEIYRKLAPDGARVRALEEWVRLGGRLVLCAGSRADEVLAKESALAALAPGRFERLVTLRQTGALESYCGSRSAAIAAGGERMAMRVPRLADVRGKIEAAEADLPLVVREARGFGQVIFIAADLDLPPLGRWTDRPLLIARLLDLPSARAEEMAESAAMMHYGFTDLAGQLRSALDNFAGVRLVPFWLVAGLIVVYIALIGPGDYFFLRNVLKRMEWTWLSFPLIVAAVCTGAYLLAYQWKGDQIRVNQIDLVDVDAASGRLRGTAWLNVFSPQTDAFNFSIEPKAMDGRPLAGARTWTAWLGLPGGALGGMNQRGGGFSLWSGEFRYAENLDALYSVPIQVWSTKSLTARWEAPAPACLDADLADADELLAGSIVNTLPFDLRDCMVAYGRWAYELGALRPGQAFHFVPTSKRSELKTRLTGRRAVLDESDKPRAEMTAYDQSSTDKGLVVRAMMFYEAAGGRRYYAGMANDYQGFVDLSDLLKAGRAILVAQCPVDAREGRQGAELLRDGLPLSLAQEQHSTLYRFVLPVKKGN